MVQGYPQSTLLAVAASRAKDKGGPTLSSVPTLRYLLYMPFRDTIRSACGSNGSHVSRVHVYPSHNETLPLPPLLPRLFFLSLRWSPFPSAVMHFGPEFQSKGLSKRQRAARILGQVVKHSTRYPQAIVNPRGSAKLIPRLMSASYLRTIAMTVRWRRTDTEEAFLFFVFFFAREESVASSNFSLDAWNFKASQVHERQNPDMRKTHMCVLRIDFVQKYSCRLIIGCWGVLARAKGPRTGLAGSGRSPGKRIR